MKTSCPICDWMGFGFPELEQSGNGYNQKCPVCGKEFNEDGLEIVNNPKEIQDPSNPGEYMAIGSQYLSGNRVNWIKMFIANLERQGIDKETIIYQIAEWQDIRPGVVRVIYNRVKHYGYKWEQMPRSMKIG